MPYRGYPHGADKVSDPVEIWARIGDRFWTAAYTALYVQGFTSWVQVNISEQLLFVAGSFYSLQDMRQKWTNDIVENSSVDVGFIAHNMIARDLASNDGTDAVFGGVVGIADARIIDYARVHPGTAGPPGPKGDPGPQGPQGPAGPMGPEGITWEGPWDRQRTYGIGEVVSFNGSTYLAVQNVVGLQPDRNWQWQLIARAGDQGPPGPPGPQGERGPQGFTGLNWWGEWNPGRLYGTTDAVLYEGSAFIATRANTNERPAVSFAWSMLASHGDPGPAGPQGVPGRLIQVSELTPAQLAQITGPPGPVGPRGPVGLTWRTFWTPDNVYAPGDALEFEGSAYIAVEFVQSDPLSDPGRWRLLAARGDQGPVGPEGPPGPEGPQGPTGKVDESRDTLLAIIDPNGNTLRELTDDPDGWWSGRLGAYLFGSGGGSLLERLLEAAI